MRITAGFVLLLAAGQLAAQDIPLPEPTGPLPVGVTTQTWIDSSRVDTLSASRGRRRVEVVIWFPAAAMSGTPAPYVIGLNASDGQLGALYARVRPSARAGALFTSRVRRAPVLLLAPGRIAGAYEYTALAEELASHGYLVIGVNSPGHSKVFVPGGGLEPVVFPSMPASSYPEGFDALQEPMNRLVGADLAFALERLPRLDRADSTLAGHLALDSVAMLGHSNGAMAGSRVCAAQPRCRAFLGIEGPQARELRLGGNDKPFAQVYGEQTLSFDTLGVFTAMRERARAPFTLFSVRGAGHNSFNDMPLVRTDLFRYPIDARRGIAVTRAIVLRYFDTVLRGAAGRDELRDVPEVRVERFPRPR